MADPGGGGGPGGPDPPLLGHNVGFLTLGPKVGPPPFVNVQEWGCFSIFLMADDVTRTMSKGGVLVKNPVSAPGPPPFKNPGSAPASPLSPTCTLSYRYIGRSSYWKYTYLTLHINISFIILLNRPPLNWWGKRMAPSASHLQASEGQGYRGMSMRAPPPPSGLAQKMYRYRWRHQVVRERYCLGWLKKAAIRITTI